VSARLERYSSESKKSETRFPLNLGVPGVPGVGMGIPRVAFRLLSEEERGAVVSLEGLMMKNDKEEF